MFVVGIETRAFFDEIDGGIPVAEHGEADDGGEAGRVGFDVGTGVDEEADGVRVFVEVDEGRVAGDGIGTVGVDAGGEEELDAFEAAVVETVAAEGVVEEFFAGRDWAGDGLFEGDGVGRGDGVGEGAQGGIGELLRLGADGVEHIAASGGGLGGDDFGGEDDEDERQGNAAKDGDGGDAKVRQAGGGPVEGGAGEEFRQDGGTEEVEEEIAEAVETGGAGGGEAVGEVDQAEKRCGPDGPGDG